MTTSFAADRTAGSASGWDDDVLRRVVKAWCGGYEVTHDAFALGIGMVPRTFARRLAGGGRKQAFSAGEVADMAAYMSRITGEKVSIAELFAGQVTVFPRADGQDQSPVENDTVGIRRKSPWIYDGNVILGPWATPVPSVRSA